MHAYVHSHRPFCSLFLTEGPQSEATGFASGKQESLIDTQSCASSFKLLEDTAGAETPFPKDRGHMQCSPSCKGTSLPPPRPSQNRSLST